MNERATQRWIEIRGTGFISGFRMVPRWRSSLVDPSAAYRHVAPAFADAAAGADLLAVVDVDVDHEGGRVVEALLACAVARVGGPCCVDQLTMDRGIRLVALLLKAAPSEEDLLRMVGGC